MKKITIILYFALFCCQGILFAQSRKLQNRPYADQRLFHIGFTMGLHTQDLILTQSGYQNGNGEVWFSEIPHYTPGFAVGMITDLYLNRSLNLRSLPTLYLGEKYVVFKEQTSGEEYHTQIRNNYLSIPLHLKISTGRIDNHRPYFILGMYSNIELGSRKRQALLLKPYDFGMELGVGCDFYLPLFNLAPELRFGFGLIDLLQKDRKDLTDESLQKYARSLSKATQRMITLSFHFE